MRPVVEGQRQAVAIAGVLLRKSLEPTESRIRFAGGVYADDLSFEIEEVSARSRDPRRAGFVQIAVAGGNSKARIVALDGVENRPLGK